MQGLSNSTLHTHSKEAAQHLFLKVSSDNFHPVLSLSVFTPVMDFILHWHFANLADWIQRIVSFWNLLIAWKINQTVGRPLFPNPVFTTRIVEIDMESSCTEPPWFLSMSHDQAFRCPLFFGVHATGRGLWIAFPGEWSTFETFLIQQQHISASDAFTIT